MTKDKNKSTKNGKIVIIIISVLLALTILGVVLGAALFKFTESLFGGNKEEKDVISAGELNSVENILYQDFKNGELSADEYVKYSMYSVYNSDNLDDKYADAAPTNHTVDLGKMVERYYDELSEETLEYYCEKVMLKGITFDPDKENEEVNQGKGLDDLFTMKAYADDGLITNLDKIVVSPNEKIIVWYTDTGASACDEKMAQKVANDIESSIEKYEKLFGYEYVFESTIYTEGENYEKQVQRLEASGLSEEHLTETMQVYIADYSNAQASYMVVPGCVKEFFTGFIGGDDYGGVVVPYIIIGPLGLKNYERMEQLYNHELFHHFQEWVFTNGGEREMDDDDYTDFISEATANWASALISNKTTPIGELNEKAGVAMYYARRLLSDEFVEANTWGNVGYSVYPYLYYYSQIVPDGVQKIIDSMYEEDAREYLRNIHIEQAFEIQRKLVINWLSKDFDNMNLVPDPEFCGTYMPELEATIDLSDEVRYEVELKEICPIGIEYYLLDNKSEEYGYKITLGKGNDYVCAYLIGVIDFEYVILESFELWNEDVWEVDTSPYTDADYFYLAVANPCIAEAGKYAMIISKTGPVDSEEPIGPMLPSDDMPWKDEEEPIGPMLPSDDMPWKDEEDSELGVEVGDAGSVGHMSFVNNYPAEPEQCEKFITTFYYNAEGNVCRIVLTYYLVNEDIAQEWYEFESENNWLHIHLEENVLTVEYPYDIVAEYSGDTTVEELYEWKEEPSDVIWYMYGDYIDFTPVF